MWETNVFAIQLLGSAAGTFLCVLLLLVLIRKRGRAAEDWLLLALVFTCVAGQAAQAVRGFLDVAGKGGAEFTFAPLLTIAAYLAPAVMLHLSLLWASGRRAGVLWGGFALYPGALLIWGFSPAWGRGLLAAVLLAAAGELVVARGRSAAPYRSFYTGMALSLVPLALAAAAGHAAMLALAFLLPPLCLLGFIYRFHIFGLLISRRVLFVFTLSSVSALYLVTVRYLAGWLESEFGTFGPVVEVALILGAAVAWLPMYQVITRFFSRQSRMHAEFSRRVIEEAASILDVRQRAGYLIQQVGRAFELRRAALVLYGDRPEVVTYGPQTGALTAEHLRQLTQWVATQSGLVIHAGNMQKHKDAARRLSEAGFNYVFPLRYQDRVTGMLLLDTAPRAFLDDTETTLVGLSSQISLSIESCRLSESKVRLEKELLEQQHLATLGRVAATIAHEVKNPLSSIKTLAQLMQEDPEVVARYERELHFIVSETNRLNSCVQQLLTYSRPLPAPGEEVELSELLESTAEFLTAESAKLGVTLMRCIEPGLKLAAGDRQSLQQVVLNLLLNAVQASPAGSRVELQAQLDGDGRIRLRITDEGPGIPAEIREKIFEPFFTTKHQGTGLGLAIVRKNVQHLGGVLELETPLAQGRGTRILVVLPRESVGR